MIDHSGFVTIVGRPNVGKSTLLNEIVGQKISIVSAMPNTTRSRVRGIVNRGNTQMVMVDTPGLHRPKSLLGEKMNAAASDSINEVDLVLVVIDAHAGLGKGDDMILSSSPKESFVVINKCDAVRPAEIAKVLAQIGSYDKAEYFPISARTGDGIGELVDAMFAKMPEGPEMFPSNMLSDTPKQLWVADLVREQLLKVAKEELPHSIATVVSEWDPPLIRVEILVERESQKPIVIGKGGAVLKEVGTRVRQQLPKGTRIELFVKVDKNWQGSERALTRLGLW
ncbi:MAG: GTPase Era [Acidimicrobiaceae bacterium]|nr:GTPase Era [Acidimicrobiaceae bacterium]